MRNLLLTSLCVLSFSFAHSTVETWDPDTGSGTLGPGGCVGNAYIESFNQALFAGYLACDWTGHESDNQPGCAYKEGQAAAEDADCHEDHQNEDQS